MTLSSPLGRIRVGRNSPENHRIGRYDQMLLQQRSDRRRTRSAFTLLEVLIVVAIIVMLSGAGSYFFFQQYEEAKLGTAKMGVNSLSGLVEQYRLKHGEYP